MLTKLAVGPRPPSHYIKLVITEVIRSDQSDLVLSQKELIKETYNWAKEAIL